MSAVSYWETNTTAPSNKNLNAVVEALGLTMAEFYGPIPKPKKAAKDGKSKKARAAA